MGIMSIVPLVLLGFLFNLVSGDQPIWRDLEEQEFPETTDIQTRNEAYRLPGNVIPLEYDISIDLYFEERTANPYSFDGSVSIVIQAIEANVNQITLHENVDSILSVSLFDVNGAQVDLNSVTPYLLEREYHFLRVNVAQSLNVGVNYTLTITYSNTMNEGPMKRGLWRGWYVDANNVTRHYAATHFQPYSARQAFPCFDEPEYKAVFNLQLSRPASYNSIFSNTATFINVADSATRTRNYFKPTPKMSVYLLTFLVSETFTVIAQENSLEPPIRIIGRSNTDGMGDFALRIAVGMTNFFDEYFQIPYGSMHENLLNDHISSPDWASAGTENWGLVSYRELYMIVDSQETTMNVEHYAVTLIAHELAHKWFGNLVTCTWWSNTWINEGFASYFGYLGAYQVFPEYDHHEHFNARYLQNSLSSDSSASSPALNNEVNTPAEVTGHFGTISYSKGAAFLRMINDMISEPTFRKALRYFLNDRQFEPADPEHLYAAFERATREDGSLDMYISFNFSEFYDTWVNEPGYPVLNVNVDHDTGEIALSQERFFLSASATPTDQIYPIPITFSTKSSPFFNNVKPNTMMTSQSMLVNKKPGEEWVIFNNLQHGHYRVNYDQKSWELIRDVLLEDPESIHYLNRAQIVDDVFALMRSERMTYDFGFQILAFLSQETNYHVWDPAITGYTWIRNRLRHLPSQFELFTEHVLNYMDHVIETLGFEPQPEETPTTSLLREDILHFACTAGHERCIEESRNRFLTLRDSGTWVDPRIRRNVYVAGIREGDEQDWRFLESRHSSSNYANDQLEMLRALAATKVPELLEEYLSLTLTQRVRYHDKVNSFNYALLGNPENAHLVLEFVKNNIDEMRTAYVEDSQAQPVHTCLSNLAAYLDEEGLEEYEQWLQETQTNTLQYNTAISSISSARTNIAWGTNNVNTVIQAARGGATVIVTSTIILLSMALIVLLH